MRNQRRDSPQRFLEQWENASGALPQGPFKYDLEIIRAIEEQNAALKAFAVRHPFSPEQLAELRRHKITQGQEHEVFVPERPRAGSLVWKVTKPDRWGLRRATPREYLIRLARLDANSNTDIRVKGVATAPNGDPLLVTTMRYVRGTHPDGALLDARLQAAGWEPTREKDYPTIATYRHKTDDTLMLDAHRLNFILTTSGHLVPIDIIFIGLGRFDVRI